MRGTPALIVTVLFGCGGEAAPNPANYTVVDSAGIEIVESLAPAWGYEGYAIDPEPLVRIGREEEGPYQFGFVYRALFTEGGAIAVPEYGSQELRIFDSSGLHLRTLGGRGEGPGEFQRFSGANRFPGDSLAAFDGQLSRITIFSPSSGEQRTILSQVEGNFAVFGILEDGHFLLYSPGGSYHPELEPGLQWVFTDVISVDPSDGSWRVLASLPGRQQLVEPDGNTGRVIPDLYSIQAVAESGFFWAKQDRFVIDFYDGDGVLRRILRRPVDPVPVDQSMVNEWIEATLEEVRRREGEEAVPRYRSRYEDALLGEHVPVFGIAFVDSEDRLWVSGPAWPSLDSTPRQWSVFSKDGFWLGDLEPPEGVRIVDSRGDLVLGVWHDEFDVPYVQVHRLDRVGVGLMGSY